MAETPKALHLVPIEQMTDAELQAKAAELEAMGRGCLLHAAEMLEYLGHRRRLAGAHLVNLAQRVQANGGAA